MSIPLYVIIIAANSAAFSNVVHKYPLLRDLLRSSQHCREALNDEDRIIYPDLNQLHAIAYKDLLMARALQKRLEENKVEFERMESMLGDENVLNSMLGVDIFSMEKLLLDSLTHRDRLKLYDTTKVCCACHARYSRFKQVRSQRREKRSDEAL